MEILITLFLCGDVMLGRGVDQIMAQSVDPSLHEPFVKDARRYVELAEARSGPIADGVVPAYVWGDALEVLNRTEPAARIINLETAVTTRDEHDADKGIHYRMHPDNVAILKAAKIDVAVLANNHVLDWSSPGLHETLATLKRVEVKVAGAGDDDDAAERPAVIDVPGAGRVVVYAFAMPDSGVPRDWAATARQPGVNFLPNLSDQSVERVAALVRATAREGDLIVFSVHWGGNWGYEIPAEQVRFAHGLIDRAGVDIVHGHSSHHVKGLEVYRGRPIFYGCGDFLNDYEGIGGHQEYRPDLTLMCLPTVNPATGKLHALRLVPMRIHKFRLNRTKPLDTAWLKRTLNRESERFGARVTVDDEIGHLVVHWD